MFWVKDPALLDQAFGVETPYVPEVTEGRPDLYRASAQWSRRWIGAKLFFVLATSGFEGIARELEHQAAMGDLLRSRLRDAGWQVVNETPLPLVCFTHQRFESGARDLREAVKAIQLRGEAWISHVVLGGARSAMRACITSFNTQPPDIDRLLAEVESEVI